MVGSLSWSRLGKNKLHKLHGVQLFKRFSGQFVNFSAKSVNFSAKFVIFSAKFVNFSAKFGSFHVQIRNHFESIIFIACKWSKIYKYFVNCILISCSTYSKEEKYAFWLNIGFTQSYRNLFFFCNLCTFSAKLSFPFFLEFTKKLLILSLSWSFFSFAFY